jgi:uncharacterized protein
MVGIADALLDAIVSIILSRKKAARIVLFGSRARGDPSQSSDIDIAVIDDSWTQQDIDNVHSRLEEEAPTALKIDLLAPHLLRNAVLVDRITREGIVIHE